MSNCKCNKEGCDGSNCSCKEGGCCDCNVPLLDMKQEISQPPEPDWESEWLDTQDWISHLRWDYRFLNMAKLISGWSKDPSTKTGAVIVRPDKSIASVGYNGFPKMMEDTPELYANREDKYSRIIHCEMNALMFSTENVTGFTLYTYPFMSCDRCFVHMVQAGITRFVAPMATVDQLERWGDAFVRVRKYAREAGVILEEIDFE